MQALAVYGVNTLSEAVDIITDQLPVEPVRYEEEEIYAQLNNSSSIITTLAKPMSRARLARAYWPISLSSLRPRILPFTARRGEAGRAALTSRLLKRSARLGKLTIRNIVGADVTAAGSPSQRTTITAKAVSGEADFSLGSAITRFSVTSMTGGSITAPLMGKLTARGDFGADLTFTGSTNPKQATIGSASIAGGINDAVWSILGGDVGSISVKGAVSNWGVNIAGKLKTAKLAAVDSAAVSVASTVRSFTTVTFLNSSLFAGYDPTNLVDPFADPSAIARFTVKSTRNATDAAFANSKVGASSIDRVSIASVDTENGGVKFGIYGDTIDSVSVNAPSFRFPGDESEGDFEVKIID